MKIQNYMQDGAHDSARIVLAYLTKLVKQYAEDSKEDSVWKNISVSRFMNCREQGYFLSVRKDFYKIEGITIAFAENRNSDDIVVYVSDRLEIFDQPTNLTLWPNDNKNEAETKYFRFDEHYKAAEYIISKILKEDIDE